VELSFRGITIAEQSDAVVDVLITIPHVRSLKLPRQQGRLSSELLKRMPPSTLTELSGKSMQDWHETMHILAERQPHLTSLHWDLETIESKVSIQAFARLPLTEFSVCYLQEHQVPEIKNFHLLYKFYLQSVETEWALGVLSAPCMSGLRHLSLKMIITAMGSKLHRAVVFASLPALHTLIVHADVWDDHSAEP
jgi:hypothetical protein